MSQHQQHPAALSPGTQPWCPELPWLLQHPWKACLLGPDAVTMLTENTGQPLARQGLQRAGMKNISNVSLHQPGCPFAQQLWSAPAARAPSPLKQTASIREKHSHLPGLETCPGTAPQEPAPLPMCQGLSKLQALRDCCFPEPCRSICRQGQGCSPAQPPSTARPSPTALQDGMTMGRGTPT